MNERIRELYYQCQDEGLSTEECYKNFAELIVQECIRIIYEQERVPKEFFYAKPAHQHELAIKKHFGVE